MLTGQIGMLALVGLLACCVLRKGVNTKVMIFCLLAGGVTVYGQFSAGNLWWSALIDGCIALLLYAAMIHTVILCVRYLKERGI